MKTRTLTFATMLFVMLIVAISARQVQGYSIVVDDAGTVVVYQGDVLGESEQRKPGEGENRRDSRIESGQKQEEGRPIQRVEQPESTQKRSQDTPMEGSAQGKKIFSANKEMEIKLRGGKEGTEVEMRQRIREEQPRQPQEQETERERGDDFKTVNTTKGEDVRIKMKDKYEVESSNETFEIRDGDVKVNTTQPVTVDTKTGALSITMPTGETRTMTTLPAEALQRVMDSGMMSAPAGSSGQENVRLEQKGDGFVYKIEGEKQKKFFGFVPIKIKREVEVSPETGEVEGVNQDWGSKVLDFFSL